LFAPHRRTVRERRTDEGALDREERADQRKGFTRPLRFGAERLEEIAALMRPAPDLDDRAVGLQMIVDGMRIGDEIALVAGEQPIDPRGVVAWAVAEDHAAEHETRRGRRPSLPLTPEIWKQPGRQVAAMKKLRVYDPPGSKALYPRGGEATLRNLPRSSSRTRSRKPCKLEQPRAS